MNFGKNLLKYANSMNITVQKELAKKLKESEKTISSYTNERSYPTYKKLVKLCNLLKCDPNTLMEGDFESNIVINAPKLNPEDQYIIDHYKSLTPHDREIVDHIFKMKPEEHTIIYRFPVFYQSAAAGIGKLSQTDDYQMEEFKLKNVPKKAVFGMYIEGHSMETIIYENDVILIDPSENEPSSLDDEIVVARFGEELICKRLSVNEAHQTYDFNSENSDDKDKGRYNQKQSNFTLVGRVVKIIHAHELGNGLISYSED